MAVTAKAGVAQQRGVHTTTWTAIPSGNTGDPQSCAAFSEKAVQISAPTGTAGSCAMEGSNDGVTYFPLTDNTNTAITATAAGVLKRITENPLYIRPNVSGGDGTTRYTVVLNQEADRL